MFILRKRGISEIVVTILIVVLVLVAVILVWSFVRPTLNTLSGLKEALSGSLSPVVSSDPGHPPSQNGTPLQDITGTNFCDNCGGGLSNLCDRDECNNLGAGGCYFIDTGLDEFYGSCNVCSPLEYSVTSCNNFTDSVTCQDININHTCGLSCSWNETDSICYDVGSGFCGDGNLSFEEECEDGNIFSGDGCNAQCKIEFCGDGIVDIGFEQCDDENLNDTDNCTNDCFSNVCGDGVCSNAESCNICSADCGACMLGCGNGVKEGTEECDDGNLFEGDGCSSLCKIQCSDSDGGQNFYMKGNTIVYNSSNMKRTYWDYCNPDNSGGVIEYYCYSSQMIGNVIYNCSNGCSNGACIGSVGNPNDRGGLLCTSADCDGGDQPTA